METIPLLKLNIGSGNKKIEGFLNVDVLNWNGNTDILLDATKTPYPDWHYNQVAEIVSEEFLEHISFRKTFGIIKEWHRILMPGGSLKIQVPDIGKMMIYFLAGRLCDCVPRKAASMKDYKPMPTCFKCHGRAIIHPERWHYAFTGAQKHEYDYHRNIFTRDYLERLLLRAGFQEIEFEDNIYKLIVKCKK